MKKGLTLCGCGGGGGTFFFPQQQQHEDIIGADRPNEWLSRFTRRSATCYVNKLRGLALV